MITIKNLNAIEGRPEWLGPWEDKNGVPYAICPNDDGDGSFGLWLSQHRRGVFFTGGTIASRVKEAGEYACKVEEEIEKWKSQSSS